VNAEAARWTAKLGLAAHPEGGWFREVFRSAERVPAGALPECFGGERALATSILYLLAAGERSRFHRLRADGLWNHHAGAPMRLHLLEHGGARTLVVGEESLQVLVPHGTWFAAEPAGEWALVGCMVSPGFEFEDFELAEREQLLAEFPNERELVTRFTQHPEERP
jgi:predicted cupin superfamily sugar epimerase